MDFLEVYEGGATPDESVLAAISKKRTERIEKNRIKNSHDVNESVMAEKGVV